MGIHIINDYPARGIVRRSWTRMVRYLGAVGIVVSMMALCPLIVVLLVLIIGPSIGIVRPRDPVGLWKSGFLVGATVVAAASLVVGFRLVKHGRKSALFLRRFDFVGATEVLTFAVATGIGSSWRLITLDDDEVEPVGARKVTRWTLRVVGALAALLALVVGIWLVFSVAATEPNPRAGPVDDFGKVLIVILALVPIALLVVTAVFCRVTFAVVGRADRFKNVRIFRKDMIEATVRAVTNENRKAFSPRLIVIKVSNPHWRETVREFAAMCSGVIIDISEPTENLHWEIKELKPTVGSRWILIGNRERVMKMVEKGARPDRACQHVLDILDGEEVLVYDHGRPGKKRFARSLRAKLATLY